MFSRCFGRGNLSLDKKDRAIGEVEKRVLAFEGLKTVYARIGEQPRGMGELSEDAIGVIQFEFADWRARPPAHVMMDAIRDKTADIPGILVEVTAPRAGPATGKPIQVRRSRRLRWAPRRLASVTSPAACRDALVTVLQGLCASS